MPAAQTGLAPVIHDIVDVLNRALDLGIAAFVAHPKVVAQRHIGHRIDQRTEALRMHPLGHEAILHGDVVALHGDAQVVPAPPLDRAMVDDDVT